MTGTQIIIVDFATTAEIVADILIPNLVQLKHIATPPLLVDGIAISVGNTVLFKNQTDASQNGVYELISADPYNGGDLLYCFQRTTESLLKLKRGTLVYSKQGNVNTEVMFVLCVDDDYTQGVSSSIFTAVDSPEIADSAITTVYLDPIDGSDSNSGLAPDDAFATLDRALRHPVSCLTIQIIDGRTVNLGASPEICGRTKVIVKGSYSTSVGGLEATAYTREAIHAHSTVITLNGNPLAADYTNQYLHFITGTYAGTVIPIVGNGTGDITVVGGTIATAVEVAQVEIVTPNVFITWDSGDITFLNNWTFNQLDIVMPASNNTFFIDKCTIFNHARLVGDGTGDFVWHSGGLLICDYAVMFNLLRYGNGGIFFPGFFDTNDLGNGWRAENSIFSIIQAGYIFGTFNGQLYNCWLISPNFFSQGPNITFFQCRIECPSSGFGDTILLYAGSKLSTLGVEFVHNRANSFRAVSVQNGSTFSILGNTSIVCNANLAAPNNILEVTEGASLTCNTFGAGINFNIVYNAPGVLGNAILIAQGGRLSASLFADINFTNTGGGSTRLIDIDNGFLSLQGDTNSNIPVSTQHFRATNASTVDLGNVTLLAGANGGSQFGQILNNSNVIIQGTINTTAVATPPADGFNVFGKSNMTITSPAGIASLTFTGNFAIIGHTNGHTPITIAVTPVAYTVAYDDPLTVGGGGPNFGDGSQFLIQ